MLFKGEINPLSIIFEHMGNVSQGPPNKRPLKGLIYASFIHSFIHSKEQKQRVHGWCCRAHGARKVEVC